MDWTGLRDFILVAECGSLSAAARRSQISQPTLGRRIEQLEQQLGSQLFIRTSRGLTPTSSGEKILQQARQMQESADAIELIASGTSQGLEGMVRVTLTDTMGNHWMPRVLPEFYQRYPGLQLDILVENRSLDLLKREADIAVRFARPKQLDLVVRQLCEFEYGMYASKEYLQRQGVPESVRDFRKHYFISYDESIFRIEALKRVENLFGLERVIYRTTSNLGVHSAVTSGLGIGITSCYLADTNPDLVRIFPERFTHAFQMWVVSHEEVYKSARIRTVFDFLCEKLSADSNSFIGSEK